MTPSLKEKVTSEVNKLKNEQPMQAMVLSLFCLKILKPKNFTDLFSYFTTRRRHIHF